MLSKILTWAGIILLMVAVACIGWGLIIDPWLNPATVSSGTTAVVPQTSITPGGAATPLPNQVGANNTALTLNDWLKWLMPWAIGGLAILIAIAYSGTIGRDIIAGWNNPPSGFGYYVTAICCALALFVCTYVLWMAYLHGFAGAIDEMAKHRTEVKASLPESAEVIGAIPIIAIIGFLWYAMGPSKKEEKK